MRKSILMLSNTGDNFNLIGTAIPSDSYFGYSDGLQTIAVTYSNFTGGVKIQGTLSLNPQNSDWFDIIINPNSNINPLNPNTTTTEVVFPANPAKPNNVTGDTGTTMFNIIGNFVYLRVVLDRSYMNPPPSLPTNATVSTQFGQLEKALLCL